MLIGAYCSSYYSTVYNSRDIKIKASTEEWIDDVVHIYYTVHSTYVRYGTSHINKRCGANKLWSITQP